MYNIIVTEEDDYSSLVFQTVDLVEAESKLDFMIEAISVSDRSIIKSPEYRSIRLEKSEVIKRVDFGDGK